jgi:hypothetical protein
LENICTKNATIVTKITINWAGESMKKLAVYTCFPTVNQGKVALAICPCNNKTNPKPEIKLIPDKMIEILEANRPNLFGKIPTNNAEIQGLRTSKVNKEGKPIGLIDLINKYKGYKIEIRIDEWILPSF